MPSPLSLANIRYHLQDKFHHFKSWYLSQTPLFKIGFIIGLLILGVLGIFFLIYHSYFTDLLVSVSDSWRDLPYGSLLIFILVFMVSFPPLIGFTALSLLTGMIYGFPQGWPLLALASVSGSTASFIIFRYLLHNQATRLINHYEMFRAFAEILSDDNSLVLLILIRLCPTPYSLSNGALLGIPELPLLTYFLATLITSPKLLIHLYIGSKIKELGQGESSNMTKIVDVISIIITGTAATLATYLIYAKMQAKLKEFHQRGVVADDVLVFGNFEDDFGLEMASQNNVELNSADFDTDNFIIEDEDDNETNGNSDEENRRRSRSRSRSRSTSGSNNGSNNGSANGSGKTSRSGSVGLLQERDLLWEDTLGKR